MTGKANSPADDQRQLARDVRLPSKARGVPDNQTRFAANTSDQSRSTPGFDRRTRLWFQRSNSNRKDRDNYHAIVLTWVTVIGPQGKQPGGHEANRASREWTAVEKFKLKGLARQGYSAEKIARVLRRPVGTTIAVASKLGYRQISNELTDARDDMRLSD